ncbi:hypothetical protein ACFO8O_10665 [Hephaestia sp. GCM10023244]|uniref:hypothetical protein n=1 Tax=unclassified Hephaestia TaxID=2631281 RepID=UPI0020771004|nr:hypothetical protein [Hephaestia sp. MAHUQ-44]MCM8731421.1 hypothetical protein [Hephaestia sp. MAHUQ-44]
MTTETRIAADMARHREFLAEAANGDPYAKMNVDAFALRLKRLGAPLPGERAPVAVTAAPTPSPAPKPKPAPQPPVSREEAIKRIGAAHAVPAEMIAAAIADGTPAADFALAVAQHVEIERVVARIVGA